MESLLGSPVALSLRVRGSVGHNFKHLTLINVKFVRRTKSRKATAKEQEQENYLHKTLVNLVVPL